MKILLDMNLAEIVEEFALINLPKYKAKQVYNWVLRGVDFDEMTDVDKKTRALLKEKYIAVPAKIHTKLVSKDKTQKYLFKLHDGNVIEGVLMNYKYGNTLCVSTQIGCRMGCKFCASTLNGLVRSLTPGEILSQVITANAENGGTIDKRQVTNIVLMGSGEPFDNYDNVVKFLNLVNSEDSLNVSYRNISLSTCGLVPEMKKFADLEIPVNLTISLHSPVNERRKEIMPIANKYSVEEIISAAKYYFDKTKRRVIFEYTLIEGQNDTRKDAENLAKVLRGFSNHLNLIRLNPVKERSFRATKNDKAQEFLKMLEEMNVSATIRRQMGVDINGACGQLRNNYLENENTTR
ncbi:MAG: 23S rRNA (adenine(2503)-C(2))-methyltransferase RlmN [Clostridia bacterium]|nr:23S rRNA (adenine(2503)-C(2))-methyltransferase RlmN [Clostridia bacterium]